MVLVFSPSKISVTQRGVTRSPSRPVLFPAQDEGGQVGSRAGMLLCAGRGLSAPLAVLHLMALYKFFFFEFVLRPFNQACSKVASPQVALINTAHDPRESITS